MVKFIEKPFLDTSISNSEDGESYCAGCGKTESLDFRIVYDEGAPINIVYAICQACQIEEEEDNCRSANDTFAQIVAATIFTANEEGKKDRPIAERVANKIANLIASQEQLDPECAQVIDEHFWEMYGPIDETEEAK